MGEKVVDVVNEYEVVNDVVEEYEVVVDKVVERPYERVVEVPVERVTYRDVPVQRVEYEYVDVPVEVVVERPYETIVEVPVERVVEREVWTDKVVEVPRYVDKEVVVEREVERTVEVPYEVYVDKEIPVYRTIEKPVYVDKVIEKEVEHVITNDQHNVTLRNEFKVIQQRIEEWNARHVKYQSDVTYQARYEEEYYRLEARLRELEVKLRSSRTEVVTQQLPTEYDQEVKTVVKEEDMGALERQRDELRRVTERLQVELSQKEGDAAQHGFSHKTSGDYRAEGHQGTSLTGQASYITGGQGVRTSAHGGGVISGGSTSYVSGGQVVGGGGYTTSHVSGGQVVSGGSRVSGGGSR